MKSAIVFVCWALIFLHCASAKTVKDPIRDYLTSWDVNRDPNMPYMEKLLVIKCDLNDSGKPSILISFNGHGGRQGNYWTAYLPTGGGYIKVEDNEATLVFREDTFYVGLVGNNYGLLSYAAGRNGGDLNLFQIVNGKLTMQKIGVLDLSKPQDVRTFESYFGKAPDWKSLKNYSVRTMSIDDLRHAGYDAAAAIRSAKDANHPLLKPLTN